MPTKLLTFVLALCVGLSAYGQGYQPDLTDKDVITSTILNAQPGESDWFSFQLQEEKTVEFWGTIVLVPNTSFRGNFPAHLRLDGNHITSGVETYDSKWAKPGELVIYNKAGNAVTPALRSQVFAMGQTHEFAVSFKAKLSAGTHTVGMTKGFWEVTEIVDPQNFVQLTYVWMVQWQFMRVLIPKGGTIVTKYNQSCPTITSGSRAEVGSPYQGTATVGKYTGPAIAGLPPPTANLEWKMDLPGTTAPGATVSASGVVNATGPGAVMIKVKNLGDEFYKDSDWSLPFAVTWQDEQVANPSGSIRVQTLDVSQNGRTRSDAPYRAWYTAQALPDVTYSVRRFAGNVTREFAVAAGPEAAVVDAGLVHLAPIFVAGPHDELVQLWGKPKNQPARMVAEARVSVLPMPSVTVTNVPGEVTGSRVGAVTITASNLYPGHVTHVRVTDSSGKQWMSAPSVGKANSSFEVPIARLLGNIDRTSNSLTIQLISANAIANWSGAIASGSSNAEGTEQLLTPAPTFGVNVSDSFQLNVNTL